MSYGNTVVEDFHFRLTYRCTQYMNGGLRNERRHGDAEVAHGKYYATNGLAHRLAVNDKLNAGTGRVETSDGGDNAESDLVALVFQRHYQSVLLQGVATDRITCHYRVVNERAVLWQFKHHLDVAHTTLIDRLEVYLSTEGEILSCRNLALVHAEACVRTGVVELRLVQIRNELVGDGCHLATLHLYLVLHEVHTFLKACFSELAEQTDGIEQ